MSFRRSATKLSIRDIRTIISDRNHRLRITFYPSLSLSACVDTIQLQVQSKIEEKEFVLPRGGYTFLDHTQSSSSLSSFRLETSTDVHFLHVLPSYSRRPFASLCARACVYARAIFPFVSFFKSSRDVFCEIIVVERRNVFSRILHFHARSVAKPLPRSNSE